MLMEEFGPVTVEQLRELFEEGTLSQADLVRCETDDAWTTFGAVKPSLFPDLGAPPAATMEEIGDLSELAFEFEDAGPTMRRETYSHESAEDPPPVSTATVSVPPMQSQTPTVADSVASVSSPRVSAPKLEHSEEPAEEWFCESFGQVLGPLSFAELIELGESGALDASDRVRCGVRGIWKTVDCLPRVMKAVAVGRAIEVDPAIASVTTDGRFGDAADSILANDTRGMVEQPQQSTANEPDFELSAEPVQRAKPVERTEPAELEKPVEPARQNKPAEPAAAVQPQEAETVSPKSRSRNPRPKNRKNAKGEGELLDEIFDDVFNDDTPPARSNAAMLSFTAASATASAGSSMNTPVPTTPPMSPQSPMTAAHSASAPQVSSRPAGASLAAAAMAASAASRPSSKSSRSSFEVNPATIGILVAVMVVAAGGWYVWQNGIPFLSGSANGNGTYDKEGALKILQATMDRYKAVGDNPSEAEWKEFSMKTNSELSVLFKTVYDQAGATPSGASCLAATMCLMKISRASRDNKEFIEKNLAEYERQIAIVSKDP